jgi:hypothetical protein
MTHAAKIAKPVAEMSEDEFTDWLCALPPPPGLPATEDEVAASDARALADLATGRVYPHAVVAEWLLTWGKPGRKPFKDWLAERHD